ncbi:hypothetical protein Nepgr_007309 [Nepenthes gracilis]|uniref:Uncharacterized protein n=1 Tax=Nepenthes gracilis TaxID=150966 RepID=A0AAD3S6X4_NEPGR|nr:hypothetical protein Nepgr_007309 [Nepenthes gracilis]
MVAPFAAAARSISRSTSSIRTTASRLATAPKQKPSAQFPFRFHGQKPLSYCRIFRSPVELSCCVESMLPYHNATASALLISLLSVAPRRCGWTSEDCNDDV